MRAPESSRGCLGCSRVLWGALRRGLVISDETPTALTSSHELSRALPNSWESLGEIGENSIGERSREISRDLLL